MTSTYNANNQQLKINFDRDKAQLLGLSTADVFNTLQSQFGSAISSQFSQFSRVWFVIMQSEPKYRAKPEDIDKLYVRNSNGEMIPLSAVITTEYTNGATSLPHYNGFPAAQVIGNAAPGYSSGQGMKALEEVAGEVLPLGYTYGWTGISYEQQVPDLLPQLCLVSVCCWYSWCWLPSMKAGRFRFSHLGGAVRRHRCAAGDMGSRS